MLTVQNYVRPQTLEEAWELNQKKKNRIIGGDITVMGDNGYVRGFQRFHSPEKDFEAEEDGDQGSSDEAAENVSGGAES